jgi:hypothetical protein
MSPEQKLEQLVDKALKELGEHCDTVQIFVTAHNPEGEKETCTASYARGIGNWFARFGQVVDWLERKCERARIEEGDDD